MLSVAVSDKHTDPPAISSSTDVVCDIASDQQTVSCHLLPLSRDRSMFVAASFAIGLRCSVFTRCSRWRPHVIDVRGRIKTSFETIDVHGRVLGSVHDSVLYAIDTVSPSDRHHTDRSIFSLRSMLTGPLAGT